MIPQDHISNSSLIVEKDARGSYIITEDLLSKEEHVLIRGKCFLYRQKAPFVKSGKSVAGALEYDEKTDQVRCHECGKWFVSLGYHITKTHDITLRDYRLRHGLNLTSSLVGVKFASQASIRNALAGSNPGSREAFQRILERRSKYRRPNEKRPHTELRNEKKRCPAQVLHHIQLLTNRLGHAPSCEEIERSGISCQSALFALNVTSLNELNRLAGSVATKYKGAHYSRIMLIEMLLDFYAKYARLPSHFDHHAGIIPSYSSYKRFFGSMESAYEAAGLGLVEKGRRRRQYPAAPEESSQNRTAPIKSLPKRQFLPEPSNESQKQEQA